MLTVNPRNSDPPRLKHACLSALAVILAGSAIGATAAAAPSQPRAAVFSDALPDFNRTLAQEAGAQVRSGGYATEFVNVAVLTNESALTVRHYDLLVLPGARSLPIAAVPAITSYLREGGDLLALGLPAWQSPMFQVNGRWLSRQDYEEALGAQRAHHSVENFDHADLSLWKRSVGEPVAQARYELAEAGQGKALHVRIGRLGGWETFASPALERPFPSNHTLTCFRAKGGPRTRQLALEWNEEDGSRWIATVDITREWRNYTLLPDRFKAWPVGAVAEHRQFNPAKAVSCWIGLALSHTALEGLEHEYWFDDLGTAPNPFGDALPPAGPAVPSLESVSPSYQCYLITTPIVVRPDHLKVALEDWEKTSAKPQTLEALSCLGLNPRARGVGFEQGRPYRWEPVLGAYDAATRDYRGALGALVVHVEPPLRGGVWAAFTPSDAYFYRQPVVSNCVRQTLMRMKRGVFLAEGGTEFFTVFAGQQFKAGARIVNFGRDPVTNLLAVAQFLDAKGGAQRTAIEVEVALLPGEMKAVEQDQLTRGRDEAGVATTLIQAGTPIDALHHELGSWEPATNPEYIDTRDGGFWLRGKPWKAHGVNYMPSSGIGLANGRYFERWLGRGAYDPDVIERDLRRVKAMNLNSVSVFVYHDSLKAQHLLDLLRRCAAHGLRVNQSLRPGTPMDFRWKEMRELIEHYRLARNDTVFAYDLAWEPTHGGYAEQARAYAGLWAQWVAKRYGSVLEAEKAWGVPAPRAQTNSASISVPPMAQLTSDGEWRKLVADYRLFLDDLLGERYGAARRLVRTIDPHHAVSFRMTCAGDPLYNWDAALVYDFYGLADAVDIWQPEAYGRIGDWERVRAGDFTAAYARLCDPAKPVLWAEMGYTVWDINRMAPDPEKLAYAGRYYTDFYRMMIESGADGVFFWWYPGGFRLGENSDFGIINPDGTDRPVTKVIRSEGRRFLKAPKPAEPDYWIAVNRDRDSRGLYGIYQAAQGAFWKTMAEGRRPALKWESRPGTTK
ncbi:MAG TPA: hypothetical protein P5205_18290 [Candidatus Paceibacterota bacterium]|nr:hypothetical protein [Verrucomicrobiota bacterium]HSA12312.1 hypothetical protein [Candidatus Paceibacterota bacterium]